MDMHDIAQQAKAAAIRMAALNGEVKNRALSEIVAALSMVVFSGAAVAANISGSAHDLGGSNINDNGHASVRKIKRH